METGTAYYIGNNNTYDLYSKELGVVGWKHSFSMGDGSVRDSHKLNELDGWIPRDQNFSGTGDEIPPYDFGCRCYVNNRMYK